MKKKPAAWGFSLTGNYRYLGYFIRMIYVFANWEAPPALMEFLTFAKII
jgi:hypothetical protein